MKVQELNATSAGYETVYEQPETWQRNLRIELSDGSLWDIQDMGEGAIKVRPYDAQVLVKPHSGNTVMLEAYR